MSQAGATTALDKTTDTPVSAGGSGRFWSPRRVPAGIVAVLLLAGAGLLLYDVAAVRAHRPAMSWRRELARQLVERQVGRAHV